MSALRWLIAERRETPAYSAKRSIPGHEQARSTSCALF
jgi:hypothetical protein